MTTTQQPAGQQAISRKTVDKALLTGPGEELVDKTIKQLSSIAGFQKIFGKVDLDPKKIQTNNRVSNYDRRDYALRQLPALNIFVSDTETKTSDNGWLTGTVSFVVYWPASQRRSDLSDAPLALKSAFENFFSSKYVHAMMDRHVTLYSDATVFGLNEYGKQLTWMPNAEGFLEKDKVPVTILKVSYRLDLRAWKRALEQQGRTQGDPFEATLDKLKGFGFGILGVDDEGNVEVVVPNGLNQNP